MTPSSANAPQAKGRAWRFSAACLVALLAGTPFFTSQAQSATVLEQTAAAMQPGTWADITSQVGGSAAIGSLLQTAPGAHINEYADKGVWNPNTKEGLYVGISHTGGYEKFIKYSDASNTFSVVTSQTNGDPQHSYQHNALNIANNDFYLRPYNSKTIRRYRNGSWGTIASIPMPTYQVAGALEAFPERNGMVFVDGDWGVWWYNYATAAWTLLKETNGGQGTSLGKFPMGPYHNVAVYNPVHKIILFGGGNGSSTLYKMDQNGNLSQETSAPTSVAINSTIFTVDPASGDYLLFSNSRGFWKYNPTTKAWAAMPSSQHPPFFSAAADGPALGTVAFPITTYGVTMYTTWNHANSKVYLYKHVAGSGTPAPTPAPPPTPTPTPAPTPAPIPTPSPSPAPSADFQTRCTAPGVIKCVDFDDAGDIAGRWGNISGILPGSTPMVLDTGTKASGNSALKFTIASNTGGGDAGSYFTNFSDDLSQRFGEGEEFYVQWRQRFSPEFITNTSLYNGASWKQTIIGEGDRPGVCNPSSPTTATCPSSCTQLEIVTTNSYDRNFPHMYHSCQDFAQRRGTFREDVKAW
jgi:hypothetical protein